MVKYTDFLTALLAALRRSPDIWPKFTAVLVALQDLYEALFQAGVPGTLSVTAISPGDAELEVQIGLVVAGPNAAFSGNLLRAAFAFLSQHPGLLNALMSWLLAQLQPAQV